MSMPGVSTTDRDQPQAAALCGVCSVTREGKDVTLCFGERSASLMDPQGTGVALRHRAVMDAGVAAQLHDLAAQLLSEMTQPPGSLR